MLIIGVIVGTIYLFDEKEVYKINVQKKKIERICKVEKIRKIIKEEGKMWIVGRGSLVEIRERGCKEGEEIGEEWEEVVKRRERIYLIKGKEIIVLPENIGIKLEYEKVEVKVKAGRIWALDKRGVSVYKEIDFKEERRIPIEGGKKLEVDEYGLRIYVVTYEGVHIFDTYTGKNIITIPQEGVKKMIVKEKNLYLLTEGGVYKVDKIEYKKERIFTTEGGTDFVISPEESYSTITRDSTLTFFTLKSSKLSRTIKFAPVDVKISPDSIIYCLSSTHLIAVKFPGYKLLWKFPFKEGKGLVVE